MSKSKYKRALGLLHALHGSRMCPWGSFMPPTALVHASPSHARPFGNLRRPYGNRVHLVGAMCAPITTVYASKAAMCAPQGAVRASPPSPWPCASLLSMCASLSSMRVPLPSQSFPHAAVCAFNSPVCAPYTCLKCRRENPPHLCLCHVNLQY
jgi:hypothetical protein